MKKLISVLLAVAMLAALCACGAAPAETPAAPAAEAPTAAPAAPAAEAPAQPETVHLKVWGSQVDQELLKELCEKFAAQHPEAIWEFEYGVVGEADAQARYLEDPAAAADVFSYPDDQIITLVQADALYEVTRNHDAIVSANAAGTVNAASYEGVLYGYPMTADNGYYLYYDKSVLSEEDVKTLDGILADLNEQADKMFSRLVKDLAEKEGITEKLKAKNQILWVQRMNAVRDTATDTIN